MENTSTHFECEIENLGYNAIEREISNYFNMGVPDNSTIPSEMVENRFEDCILICTEKSGEFSIEDIEYGDGTIWLIYLGDNNSNKS